MHDSVSNKIIIFVEGTSIHFLSLQPREILRNIIYSCSIDDESLSLSRLREEEISREDTRWRDKFRNDPEKQKRKRIGSDLVKLDNCCSGFFAKKPSLELVLSAPI